MRAIGFHLFICGMWFSVMCRQESCAIAKMTAQYAPYTCRENFWDSLTTPTAISRNIFHGLLFRSTL